MKNKENENRWVLISKSHNSYEHQFFRMREREQQTNKWTEGTKWTYHDFL